MKRIFLWAAGVAAAVSAVLVAPLVAQEEEKSRRTVDPSVLEERRQQRIEWIRAERGRVTGSQGRTAGLSRPRALLSPTIGGRPSPQVVGTATDVALDIDGDFDIGGYLFKDGVPFLHNDGGATYGNTALGLNALVNATLVANYPYATEGAYNTAIGFNALEATTDGHSNTALGHSALRGNTLGYSNVAVGSLAIGGYGGLYNTIGSANTVVGSFALVFNEEGNNNTALGAFAMQQPLYDSSNNTAVGTYALFTTGDNNVGVGFNSTATGDNGVAVGAFAAGGTQSVSVGYNAGRSSGIRNTSVGYEALKENTGNHNTAVGYKAGQNWTTGVSNIALGSGADGLAGETQTIRIGGGGEQTRAFIEGIRGRTTGSADAITVLIDSAGQLGTMSSSARVKEDIVDVGNRSSPLLDLRPVAFRYRQPFSGGDKPIQFGLVAEEVSETFPELVVHDEHGRPETIRYHWLSTLLLNELQNEKQLRETEVEDLRRQIAELRTIIADLKRREEIQLE